MCSRSSSAVERYPRLTVASGIVRVERLDGDPLAVGSRLRISQSVAGRSTVLDGAVTVLGRDPPSASAVATRRV